MISPVKALSDQDKPVHAALVLSLSRYCGHVNSHFHHNWPRFWQYCCAGPSVLYSSVSYPHSLSPSFFSPQSSLSCSLCFLSFLFPWTTEFNRYGWWRVKLVFAHPLPSMERAIMESLIIWTDTVENCNMWCNTYAVIYYSPRGEENHSICVTDNLQHTVRVGGWVSSSCIQSQFSKCRSVHCGFFCCICL